MKTKTYKQIFLILAVSVFIVPQIVLAAWWNPFSWSIWNIFWPTPHAQVQIATTTAPTTLATTTEKTDTKVVSTQKPVVDSTQKVSQPNIKQPSVAVPSQPIPTPAPSCTQDTWSCSDWLVCSSSGSQTRSCNKTFECPSVVTQSPVTSQFCTPPAPSCQADTWSCGDWNSCSASGNQTRSCSKTFECPSVVTQSPTTSQSCTPPTPSCQADTWSCDDWNACSASGNQTRSCTKTFDCSVANTPSPNTAQSCTPPYTPPSNPVITYSDYNFSYTYSYQYPDPEWIKRFNVAETSRNLRITRAVFRITDEDAEKYDSITDRSQPPRLRFCKQQCQMYTLERTDKNTFIYVGSQTGGVPIAEGYIYLEIPIPAYAEGMITNFSIPTSEWEIWDGTTGKPVDM